jgi:magnesium transporter
MTPPRTELTPQLQSRLSEGVPSEIAAALASVHEADLAEALNRVDSGRAAEVISALPFEFAVRVVEHPELERRHEVFHHFPTDKAVAFIQAMSPDQQAHLFRRLPDADRTRFLEDLDASTRATLALLLAFPPTTAGGIMTTDYLSVPSTATAGEALDHVAHVGRRKPVYAIYVLDPGDRRVVHVVSLRELVVAERRTAVLEVGEHRGLLKVAPMADREDVARLLSKYNLLAVPVVDEHGHLLGTITVDDVIDAVVKEQTEDLHKMGGLEALDEPYSQIAFGTMIRKRAGWLCALFLGEMLTATAMQHFEAELSHAIVLGLFIPLIISSGGNSGSQATSLIIRALALREVRVADWWWVAARELPAGISLGAILGVIGILRITAWQSLGFYDYGPSWPLVALTVGAALVGVVTFGSLAGSMLPFILRRLGFDPASASAPFVATLVDVTGLIIYFGVALLILHGTLL